MTCVLACLDGSAYTDAVCDYAAWLADLMDGEIRLLHVQDGARANKGAPPPLRLGLERMAEHGVTVAEAELDSGSLVGRCVGRAAAGAADAMVVGKRGFDSRPDSRALGHHVGALIGETDQPVLLASRTFLPVARTVCLLDADLDHRRTVEFLCTWPRLAELGADVVIASRGDEDASAKVDWARDRLAASSAEVFQIDAGGVNRTAAEVMEARGADLIIVSRAVLAGHAARGLTLLEEESLWAWRTPVLVC
jgi:nucleotide-binding universal stress UspA family protein